MELRDFMVTPIIVMIIYAGAYLIRPYVTDAISRQYFFPALTIKIVGAISLGIIYQFYYRGGDTFVYHTFGSRLVWKAFNESPLLGLKLLFANATDYPELYRYASGIYFFRDPSAYAVVRLASIFDLFTFSTYSSTAVLFAVLSFIGAWQFYLTFYKQYPHLHRPLAIAAFFIPSVFFWGSGILKDTITLAFLEIATYQIYLIFISRKYKIYNLVLLLISLYIVFIIKIFILQAYLPAAVLWIGLMNMNRIRSSMVKLMFTPFMLFLIIVSSYLMVVKVSEDDARYSVSKLAETARITAYDIRYFTGRDAGSGYSLGELDGTFSSMIRLAPQAINVTLFRPYIWEVINPLMFISALESLALILFVIFTIVNNNVNILTIFRNHNIAFALVFSIVFAFGVGISTYNFGTLARYKIPLLPFFIAALVISNGILKKEPTNSNTIG